MISMLKGKYIRTPENKKKLSLARKAFLSVNPHPLKGKKHKPETKKKISIARTGQKMSVESRLHLSSVAARGSNHPNWKGGVTPVNKSIRASLEYRLWRGSVFERDNYTCVWCNARNGNGKRVVLNADHIKPFAYFPELRFAIDNGRTLCVPCHRTTFKDIWKK